MQLIHHPKAVGFETEAVGLRFGNTLCFLLLPCMSLPLFFPTDKSFSFTFTAQVSSFIQISAGFRHVEAPPGWRWCDR